MKGKMCRKKKHKNKKWKSMIHMGIVCVLLYPIFFVLLASLCGDDQVKRYLIPLHTGEGFVPFIFLTGVPLLRNYFKVLLDMPEFFVMLWNSMQETICVVVGQLMIAVPAAWGLSKVRGKKENLLYTCYVILMVIPFIVLMLPQYNLFKQLSLLDTHWAVILPGIFSGLPVVIMYPYFKAIPRSMLEAASVDGCNEWKIFWYIAIPMAKPAIVTSVLLNFVEYWSIFEQPFLFIETKNKWNLSMFLANATLDQGAVVFVSAALTMLPPFLLFLYGKEDMEEGIPTAVTNE